MSTRRALSLAVVILAGVIAALLFRSNGGRREAPPADKPPELAPRAAVSPPVGTPVLPASVATEAASPTPPEPSADRPDAGVPPPRAPLAPLRDALAAAKDAGGRRLYADLSRTGRPIPPETRTLVEMKEGGATAADLSAYVNRAFPADTAVRGVALKWIRLHTSEPLPATDAGAQARSRISRTTPAP